MNITSINKLYYLGKDDKYAYIVFLDSKDNFLYTVRPLSDKGKITNYHFDKDTFYSVTYNPDPIKTNPEIFELISVSDPITNTELLF